MTTDIRTCPRCAHRPHAPHGCEARYHVTFEASEPGDPCLCPEAALPVPPADGVPRTAAGPFTCWFRCNGERDHEGPHYMWLNAEAGDGRYPMGLLGEAAQPAPGLDVEALGLSAEQTTILRDHLASRQQTLSEFLGDMLMDIGLGRATGREYPPPAIEEKPVERISGFANPDGSGEGNWSAIEEKK